MKVLPLMMSHLFGRAVLDQGPDHQPFLGLVFSQTEAKTCMILREERKSQQNAPHKSRNKKQNPCRISAKTWGRMTCWMSVECAESGCDRSHSVLDPWAFGPRAALFLMEVKKKKKKTVTIYVTISAADVTLFFGRECEDWTSCLMRTILTLDGALLMMVEAFWWLLPYRICPLIWKRNRVMFSLPIDFSPSPPLLLGAIRLCNHLPTAVIHFEQNPPPAPPHFSS